VTMRLQGQFVVCRMGLAKISKHTKIEVSVFTTTMICKATQNVENGVVWGG